MWSSNPEEGLVEVLTAERDNAREWARIFYARISSAEKAYLRTSDDFPEWPEWLEEENQYTTE